MRNVNNALFDFEPGTMESLVELALDLRNCWDHTTDPAWSKIEPELWERTHNPWVVLQTASRTKLKVLESDAEFGNAVRVLLDNQREGLKTDAWFQRAHENSSLSCVAYFSMEFRLSEALPIYSGGLGNVAGDQLKAASDLGPSSE
jgi:starch phosphorylase